jgi:2-isopropylmalate synthase
MGLAVGCALEAVNAGAAHIQGTLLGFGERCGNTALSTVIPTLHLKMSRRCISGELAVLREVSLRVAEIANRPLGGCAPYIGANAFSHKAGMHADAILKVRRSFEHIDPLLVGNDRHFLMSEMGGRAAIVEKVKNLIKNWKSFTESPQEIDKIIENIDAIDKNHPGIVALSQKLKNLESEGWQFEGADASFAILARKEFHVFQKHFEIVAYRVMSEHPASEGLECSHAWVKILVDGQTEIAAAEGDGPVNALDGALRRALLRFYPALTDVRLYDYKVRVIDGNDATAAKVRVLVESTDGAETWTTVGVSADIIDASRAALVDSIEYKLMI